MLRSDYVLLRLIRSLGHNDSSTCSQAEIREGIAMSVYAKLACFIGGVLFGSVGIKLLSSKDAKKAYTHITAAGLRMKDSAMETVTTVQENAADISGLRQGY
ncbi:MAG: DUF6110 family protein, partial [Oscillospiraceae bacterium]